jgi:hypothetical protein
MSTGTFLYFAYGSNMFSPRLQAPERCPSARPLGAAVLPGHDLRWHKHSKKDGSGKCDIIVSSAPGASVYGVLYEIAENQRSALDREEGLGKGYDAIEANVIFSGSITSARSYQATITDSTLRPYTWYRALVVAGAKEHGLPADYIGRLEAVHTIDDPDGNRHERNMRLLGVEAVR